MNFVDISTLQITTELDVLKRDTQPNSIFLYQHTGVFHADNNRIGNHHREEAQAKFTNLLTKAKTENASLVVSPEYSCPLVIINALVDDENLHPAQNKLWALGGESLNKEELNSLRQLNSENTFIHFEDVHNNSDKNYVDPLYYIFKGQHNGNDKLIIIIQFKTRHMGGLWSSQTEPNNLIEGNTVYIIKNTEHSVRLISFICSEAMNFNASNEQELIQNHSWTDSPFLILSLQFNPNPSHPNFISFKQFALKKERRELISLNWGIETTFLNGDLLYKENTTPRSGIYFKTSDIELDYKPKKIVDNHKKGLYFLQILRNKRVYFLNGNVALFKIENKSVHINDGVEEQQRREGPMVDEIFKLDANLNFEAIDNISDNHIEFLNARGVTNNYFLNPNISIIDKERLLNISMGKVRGKEENKWCDVIHLNSFNLTESDECNNRLTYIEDTYPSSEAVRSTNCTSIFELDVNIIPTKEIYPHSIKHLADNNISLAFASNANTFNYKYNVVDKNGNIEKATICYVGNAVSSKVIKKAYDELQNLFDTDSPGKNTIVVFYKQGNSILSKSNAEAGAITEIPNNNSSIF